MKLAVAALLSCLAAAPTQAQEVYRCGHVYSHTACAQGRLVGVDDSRTAAQRAEASRVAVTERQLAVDMRSDRLAEAAALRPALAGSLSAPKVVAATERSAPKKKRGAAKPAAQKDFVVTVASAKKKRTRS